MIESIGPGTKVAGRYVIEEHLASGGMASVWRARDAVLARVVAVKTLRTDLATDPEFRERFRREAVASARLNHPAIIHVFDTGVDGPSVFIVMEYFEGRTLAEVLRQSGPFEPGRAVDAVVPVLEALAYAHAHGIVHRDVKPGNILVSADGQVKVTDFGIAKAATRGTDLTTTGQVLGTAQYLSPEQVQGQAVDGRSDLYSAGAVLYELLTGRPPFDAETPVAAAMMRLTNDPVPPRDVRPGIPKRLEASVLRALARKPEDRFQTADAMRASLESWGDGAALTPPEGIPVPPTATIPVDPGARATVGGSLFRSWMAVPLIVIGVAAVLILAGLALGRLEFGGPLGVRAAPNGGKGGGGAGVTIPIRAAQDFDPFGDGSEHPEDAGLAVDGDPGTAWATDHYSTAKFGQLKPGLGLWLDLGSAVKVDRLTVTSPVPGWTFELIPGAEPNDDADPLASSSGKVDFTIGAGGSVTVELPTTTMRGVMIWITNLAPDGGRYAAAVSEVRVRGPK